MDDAYKTLIFRKTANYAVVDLTEKVGEEVSLSETAADLAELCEQIAWDDRIRVVLLSYNGAIKNESKPDWSQYARMDGISLTEPIARLKQPVIAAIRGDALGLGLELALACDIRIGSENARFGLPQIREGQMPSDGGTQRLPRLIGQSKAMQLILTGESIDAREACRSGLINRIAPAESLIETAMEMARGMAENSPLSLSYAKEALYKGMDLTLEQGIRMELDLYLHLFTTADRTEGVAAFREKRKPKFEGI